MSASTLGMQITAESITFTASGDAKRGEERGLLLGMGIMHERIEKGLLYEHLLTDEVRAVLGRVKHELMFDQGIVICKYCAQHATHNCPMEDGKFNPTPDDWFCADWEPKGSKEC